MAPKRSARAAPPNPCINHTNLTLNDALCPICRTVLIEPVTLPCSHAFCLTCFNSTMEHTNLACPLCRLRISSWLRHSKKANTLVDSQLWEAVKKAFPSRVWDKLNGKEEPEREDLSSRRIARDGEIRKEYETEKAKVLREHDLEIKASEEYIKRLQEQEQLESSLIEENTRLSEQLALKLNGEPGPSTSKKLTSLEVFLQAKSTIRKDDDFRDSSDCITSECRYFKPIDRRAIPAAINSLVIKVPAVVAKAPIVIVGPSDSADAFSHSTGDSAFAPVALPINPLHSVSTISMKKRTAPSPCAFKTATKRTKDNNSPVLSNGFGKSTVLNHQARDDFKLAVKLHRELNNFSRPSRGNNNIRVPIANTRKSARQVTLKEIITQAASI